MNRKTPQEKKALSYKKDRRNAYGENDTSSRKNIPLNKRKQNRVFRKNANQTLSKVKKESSFDELELIDNEVKGIKKGSWKKYPDTPLGEIVESRLAFRERNVGKGKTARKRIREAVKKLEITVYQESENLWVAEIKGFEKYKIRANYKNVAILKAESVVRVAAEKSVKCEKDIFIDDKFIKAILEKN